MIVFIAKLESFQRVMVAVFPDAQFNRLHDSPIPRAGLQNSLLARPPRWLLLPNNNMRVVCRRLHRPGLVGTVNAGDVV